MCGGRHACRGRGAEAEHPPVAVVDSTPPPSPPPPPPRAGWLSDRLPLRTGDILTVLIDERMIANEQDSRRANNNRSQSGTFGLGLSAGPVVPKTFGIGYGSKSDNGGQADRSREFSTVLSVRVTGVDPGGIVKIEGRKTVVVDGRKQEVVLNGFVRAEDVAPDHSLVSSRIADATITFKGATIGPKTGIFGKILGIFWP